MRNRHDLFEEDLTAQVNGVLVDFPTTYKFWPGTTVVHLNGVDQGLPNTPTSAWSETGDQAIHFAAFVPAPPDKLVVLYRPR